MSFTGIAQRLPKGPLLVVGVAAAAFGTAAVAPEYRLNDWSLWAIYGLLALSFTFVWGHGGIFSFGQAAFFGLGGYAYGVTSIDLSPRTGESISALVVSAVFAALVAGLVGYFIFYGNVGDVYVAIITLAATLVLLTFVSSTADPRYHIGTALLGGYNGMAGIPPVMYGSLQSLDTRDMFVFCVVVAVSAAVGLRALLRRPFGRVLAGVRENELRTQLIGYDVRRYKLGAFVLAGALAGLAGGLYAAWGLFLNPSVFSLAQAATVAIWVLVGGRTSFLGAFVGVGIVQGLSSALGGSGGSWTPIVLGAVLIVVVLLLPDGVIPTLQTLLRMTTRRSRSHPPVLEDASARSAVTGSSTANGDELDAMLGGATRP